ncbi:LADA_0G07866g1_1 [Lachancea dasiensis]|uniref:Palmitoyltransferase n=1 Tax=Lachancea dasiensis TaxID=1072105 RepID=A0A1G4JU36_9SACH|nr:LADA_0G07866g1_1 [Lachancea dasiensis]
MALEHHLWFRCLVPLVLLGLLCYASWAFCYALCYREVYHKFGQKSIGVGLMFGQLVLVVVLIGTWSQLVAIGPGRQPKVLPFRILPENVNSDGEEELSGKSPQHPPMTIVPPSLYQCDPQGYPLWCTACQTIKGNRTHHSSTLGYCVPRFDHYCVWIGTVVGRKNYRLFMQFTMYAGWFCIFVIASIASFLRRMIASRKDIPRVDPNILVLLALCCVFMLMVGPLFLSHCYYMAKNRTSLEVIATKRRSKATKNWLCYLNPVDGLRYVFEFKALDTQDYWKKRGVLANIKEFLGPQYWFWLVPLGTNIKTHDPNSFEYEVILGPYQEVASDQLRELLHSRIANGDFAATFEAYGDKDK